MARAVTKKNEFLSESERLLIFGDAPKSLKKQPVSFRLTTAALGILDEEAQQMGVGRTQVLEYLLRKIRAERK